MLKMASLRVTTVKINLDSRINYIESRVKYLYSRNKNQENTWKAKWNNRLLTKVRRAEARAAEESGIIITEQHSAKAGLIAAIASRLMPMIASQLKPAPDPLAGLRGLEEAYRNTWLLSTSELAQLLKLSPKTVRSYGDQFSDAGFVFTRAGTRKRGEVAWRIHKLG